MGFNEIKVIDALERMERRAKIALKHTKEDMDSEKAERWKRAVEHYTCAAEAIKEIQKYQAIGTVEECREAVEKQRAEKPIEDSCEEKTHYKCPCGYIFMTVYLNGRRMGNTPKYCERCGQAIDWSDA